jgi:hypothetical protein
MFYNRSPENTVPASSLYPGYTWVHIFNRFSLGFIFDPSKSTRWKDLAEGLFKLHRW